MIASLERTLQLKELKTTWTLLMRNTSAVSKSISSRRLKETSPIFKKPSLKIKSIPRKAHSRHYRAMTQSRRLTSAFCTETTLSQASTSYRPLSPLMRTMVMLIRTSSTLKQIWAFQSPFARQARLSCPDMIPSVITMSATGVCTSKMSSFSHRLARKLKKGTTC